MVGKATQVSILKKIDLDGGLSVQLIEIDHEGAPEVFMRIESSTVRLALDSAFLPNEPTGLQLVNEMASLLNFNQAVTANTVDEKLSYELKKLKLEVQVLEKSLSIEPKKKSKKKKRKK